MEKLRPKLAADAGAEQLITVQAYINGENRQLSTTFDVIGPYTNTVVWRSSSANVSDALQAVEAAKHSFPAWSTTYPAERRRILSRAADLIESRLGEYAGYMRTEMGADFRTSEGLVGPLGVSLLRECAARTTAIEGSVPVSAKKGQSVNISKVPVGVVLGIVTWNAPFVFGARSIGSVLAAGCTTVIKASERTPRTYWALASAFHDAGLPPGVLNIISCRPEDAESVTSAMIEHPAVRKINFTGSTATGREVAVACARNLNPCLLELGGKNSAIVLEDANLETAAAQVILGGFLNSGQICMSTDRVIVVKSIAMQFQEILKATLKSMFPDENPAPTISSAKSKTRVDALVSEAREKGAITLEHGYDLDQAAIAKTNGKTLSSGVFSRPMVMCNVTQDMRIWNEEIFGNAIAVMIVDDEAQAIEMANSTGYGLSAAVFTEDLRRGMRVSKLIETGLVHINQMTVQDDPTIPFGGVKQSGWGRFNGAIGLEEFLITKATTWMD